MHQKATTKNQQQPKKSKWFRVAVEGATSDGRTIDRELIEQVAKNYNPATYGARINIEHIRGYSPESEFRAYGDVLAVKAEEVEIGGKKKLALFAQIDATDELIALNRRRQKIYSSIEVRPSFADTGEAYLIGLAVTDNPASLGTEMLQFAAQNPTANPFAARKEHPDDIFAVAEPLVLEFDDADGYDHAATGLLDKLKTTLGAAIAKFASATGTSVDARFDATAQGITQIADIFADHASAAARYRADTDQAISALQAQVQQLQQQYAALDSTEQPGRRPAATGGSGAVQTDY